MQTNEFDRQAEMGAIICASHRLHYYSGYEFQMFLDTYTESPFHQMFNLWPQSLKNVAIGWIM